jgi:S-adenosylmethionine-dependent methyltransferase
MSVDQAPAAFAPSTFDAIACHTLIEYLPEPRAGLAALSDLLRPGGVLSVSFVNRHAEVLRQVWSRHDPAGALARLEGGTFCASLFGVQGMAYTAEEVSAWLGGLGLEVTATCGVRAFADQVPAERLEDPAFLDALLRLERAAATRSPYRLVARYVHLIARKVGATHPG